ncbi:glycosyltransferase family 4 protein [Cellulomonas marina]|uniref:glycosyltransferase family 4 protein n=1 Tax=Cellulomonas marina TaxID=988821 RepID=UPI00158798B0|nr:glycosyltransferase family 4 protein [Cellulomonas marina]
MTRPGRAPARLRLGLVVHEFGRTRNHGGIAAVAADLVEALGEVPGLEVHVVTTQEAPEDGELVVPANCRVHRVRHHEQRHFAAVADLLDALDLHHVEVADAYALGVQFLVRRELGLTRTRPVVEVCHHTGHREIWEWGTGRRGLAGAPDHFRRTARLEEVQTRLADASTAPSTFLARYLEGRTPGLQVGERRFPTVDLLAADPAEVWRPGTATTVLSLGRWEARKRQEDLLTAARAVSADEPDLLVHLVGNTIADPRTGIDYRYSCYAALPPTARRTFRMHEFASASAMGRLYEEAGWFCVPSPRENFPTTAVEALARGLPVLASAASGVADYSGDVPEVLFDPDVPGDLERVLRWAVVQGPKVRETVWRSQFDAARRLLSREATATPRVAAVERAAARADARVAGPSAPPAEGPSAAGLRTLLLLPPGSDQPSAASFALGWQLRVSSIEDMSDPALAWAQVVVSYPSAPGDERLERLHTLLGRWDLSAVAGGAVTLTGRDDAALDLDDGAHHGTVPAVVLVPTAEDLAEPVLLDVVAGRLARPGSLLPLVDARAGATGHSVRLMLELRDRSAGVREEVRP